MNKVPWWYWPVALVPAAICAALIPAVLRAGGLHSPTGLEVGAPEAIGIAFSLYAALVLLGYLLLALCGHRHDSPSSTELNTVSAAHAHDI